MRKVSEPMDLTIHTKHPDDLVLACINTGFYLGPENMNKEYTVMLRQPYRKDDQYIVCTNYDIATGEYSDRAKFPSRSAADRYLITIL